MNNQIKMIKQISYKAIFKFGELTKGERDCSEFYHRDTYTEYDRLGNVLAEGFFNAADISKLIPYITKRCEYISQGKIIQKKEYNTLSLNKDFGLTVYLYNENGLLERKRKYSVNSFLDAPSCNFQEMDLPTEKSIEKEDLIQLEKTVKYKYDNKNQKIEKVSFKADGSFEDKKTYKYDDKGNKIETAYYKTENEIETRYVRVYVENINNNESHLLKETQYNSENILESKRQMIRDELGRVIEFRDYDSNGKLVNTDVQKYDESGHTFIVNYGAEGYEGHHYMLYRYNLNDLFIEEGVYNPDGSVYSRNTNTYDADDNLIESRWIEFADEFVCTSSKYEYDKYNNWIKRIDFVKEIPEYIIEREITYFV